MDVSMLSSSKRLVDGGSLMPTVSPSSTPSAWGSRKTFDRRGLKCGTKGFCVSTYTYEYTRAIVGGGGGGNTPPWHG